MHWEGSCHFMLICQTGKMAKSNAAAATMFSVTSGIFTVYWSNVRVYTIIYSMSWLIHAHYLHYKLAPWAYFFHKEKCWHCYVNYHGNLWVSCFCLWAKTLKSIKFIFFNWHIRQCASFMIHLTFNPVHLSVK